MKTSRVRLYDRYTTYCLPAMILIGGLVVAGITVFLSYKFLFKEFEPAVIFLIALYLGPLCYAMIGLKRIKLLSRLLLQCQINEEGIFCSGIGWKPFELRWDRIRTYGVYGYSKKNQPYGFMYFSLDANEKYHEKDWFQMKYSNRVVFQIRDESWQALSEYVPEDMKRDLQWSIDHRKDCFKKR